MALQCSGKKLKRKGAGLFFFLVCAVVSTSSLAQPPAPIANISVRYKVTYRFGFLRLFDLADVTLKLYQEPYRKPGLAESAPSQQSVAAIFLIRPSGMTDMEEGRKRRVFFDSYFKSSFDAETFGLLHYQKRIREDVRLGLIRSKKNYLEEVIYDGDIASFQKENFLEKRFERREIDLKEARQKKHHGVGAQSLDLPTLLGRALFQKEFFLSMQDYSKELQAQMITHTRTYEFKIHTRRSRADSPLTGKVRAVRVDSDILFHSRKGEIVPFVLWLSSPHDLTPTLRSKVEAAGIFCFPTALRMEFTVGSIQAEAQEFLVDPANTSKPLVGQSPE